MGKRLVMNAYHENQRKTKVLAIRLFNNARTDPNTVLTDPHRSCILMGDFNGKVSEIDKEELTVGRFGLGTRMKEEMD